MRALRSLTSLIVLTAAVLGAAQVQAVTFTFAGKFTSNRGKIINIPVVGNTPCAPLTIMSNYFAMPVTPAPVTPAVRTIIRGANTQPQIKVMTGFVGYPATTMVARDLQCVKHAPNKFVMTTGAGPGGMVGGAFVFPNNAFSKPLPPYVRAVEVKYAPPVLQLATSFKITGPPVAINALTPPNGTMNNGVNTAAFRAFKAGAWMTQTGRAGSMFTWCPGSPACATIQQGSYPLIVKYQGGGNAFGGTMSYIITTGPNVSSLAVAPGGGALGFALLAGMGSQPTGRGYADYLTDMLAAGPFWNMYARMTVIPGPIVGMQKLITSVMTFAGNIFPGGVNVNWGFPFTTMTVLARNTGTAQGNPRNTTITAMGSDMLTAMGGRNISLVAGGAAVAKLTIANTPTPELASMKLTLPEPGGTMQMLAGALALLGIAAWRSRKSR
jgi:hypothetical protein